MTDVARPLTRRGLILRMGLWAVGIGVVLLAGGFLWKSLFPLGGAAIVTGAAWLVISPFCSTDVVRKAHLRHVREMLLAMGGYFVALFVLNMAKRLYLPPWALVLATLLPVLMVALVVVSEWRQVRDSDELEQRVQLEAMHVAGGVTGILAFAAGMLREVGVFDFDGGLILVLPMMFLLYGAASWWFRRKYGLGGMC
ncbi:MAG TPA: hypothetical protein VFL78_11890 [Rhodanobacteraceae bacterium]|nr:hypothetical protein [Rhodanobacteraceae bacterium]